jgi:hypothetical protein
VAEHVGGESADPLNDPVQIVGGMQVGDERFNEDEINRLYDDGDYPLRKSLSDWAWWRDRIGSPLQSKLRISDPHRVISNKS